MLGLLYLRMNSQRWNQNAEMEVTKIMLAEERVGIFKSIGPNLWISLKHKTPFNDLKLLLKVVFDETHSNQPKIHREIHTSLWILNISRNKSANQKSQTFVKCL